MVSINLLVVIRLFVQPEISMFLPDKMQKLTKLAEMLLPDLGKALDAQGNVIHVADLPFTINLTMAIKEGIFIMVFGIVLSAFLTHLVLKAHYFAHNDDVYESKRLLKVVSLAKARGLAWTVLILTMAITAAGLHLYGMTLAMYSFSHGGMIGDWFNQVAEGQGEGDLTTYSLLGFTEALQKTQPDPTGFMAVGVRIIFTLLLVIIPFLQMLVIIVTWVVPMPVMRLNQLFRLTSALFTWSLLDVYICVTGVTQSFLKYYLEFRFKDACKPIEEFLQGTMMDNGFLFFDNMVW
jgi:hypothetical protein